VGLPDHHTHPFSSQPSSSHSSPAGPIPAQILASQPRSSHRIAPHHIQFHRMPPYPKALHSITSQLISAHHFTPHPIKHIPSHSAACFPRQRHPIPPRCAHSRHVSRHIPASLSPYHTTRHHIIPHRSEPNHTQTTPKPHQTTTLHTTTPHHSNLPHYTTLPRPAQPNPTPSYPIAPHPLPTRSYPIFQWTTTETGTAISGNGSWSGWR
jgi:hypothetical protein